MNFEKPHGFYQRFELQENNLATKKKFFFVVIIYFLLNFRIIGILCGCIQL